MTATEATYALAAKWLVASLEGRAVLASAASLQALSRPANTLRSLAAFGATTNWQ